MVMSMTLTLASIREGSSHLLTGCLQLEMQEMQEMQEILLQSLLRQMMKRILC